MRRQHQKNATAVALYQQELNNDKTNLSREKINKNDDIVAVNSDLKDSNAEFAGVLVAENFVARTKNQIEK